MIFIQSTRRFLAARARASQSDDDVLHVRMPDGRVRDVSLADVRRRVQQKTADGALYAAAWGSGGQEAPTRHAEAAPDLQPLNAADAALYRLAWGED